jgi:fructan beta-fructosidase
MKRLLFLLPVLNFLPAAAQTPSYKEPYRPQFHFSPAINWINDPNGLVWYRGEYHLFYQYNPFGNVWGHMSWGHAVSKDLLHWQQLPLAIPEENGIMIFSGSAVADTANTSGFGTRKNQPPMVAVYTGHTDTNQSQHLAYSTDRGRTWTKYPGNPVLDLHRKDFRDPNVSWYAPSKSWVMALMLPDEHKVQFYGSKDLKSWAHLSDFGPAGDTAGVWECPDLLQVPVEGYPDRKKWVLLTSQNFGMQYFVGEFDGTTFTSQNPALPVLRPDYGPDYYAAICYNAMPGRQAPVSIGWINNWTYANDIPTTPWKGAMSLPRVLSVKKVNDSWVLLQKPLPGLQALRLRELGTMKNELLGGTKQMPVQSQQFELEMDINPAASGSTGLRIAAGNGHELEIGYDAGKKMLYLDRGKTETQSFSKAFKERSRYEAPVSLENNSLRLHIFFDHSIVEVFANDGETVLTAQLFPGNTDSGIELFSTGGNTRINSLAVWELKSAW